MAMLRRGVRRAAVWFWIVLAFVVWNGVFDRVIIDAEHESISLAVAAEGSGPYVKIDDTMRPAEWRALWRATASAGVVLAAGFVASRLAKRT